MNVDLGTHLARNLSAMQCKREDIDDALVTPPGNQTDGRVPPAQQPGRGRQKTAVPVKLEPPILEGHNRKEPRHGLGARSSPEHKLSTIWAEQLSTASTNIAWRPPNTVSGSTSAKPVASQSAPASVPS